MDFYNYLQDDGVRPGGNDIRLHVEQYGRARVARIVLKPGTGVAESDEGKPGVILDYDAEGNLVSLEILDASRRVTEARRMEFELMG